MRRLLLYSSLIALAPAAANAQPTSCRAAPPGYDETCLYGALPAVFDDFVYGSDAVPAPGPDSKSIYALNQWHLGDRSIQAPGWYRFNRHHLPTAGHVRFGDSVMRMELPAGTTAEAYPRSNVLLSTFTMGEGTYHWRVRLSDHWRGQRIRQSVWAISPTTWAFTERTSTDSTRYIYWSELDFENENHFQGERRDGVFYPDYSTRMSVTNHVGYLLRADGTRRRLSHDGPVDWWVGSSALVRSAFARRPSVQEAPLVERWEDTWWSLLLHVDSTARTVTYRMIPESDAEQYEAVAERAVTFDEAFYPRAAVAAAFSLHWLTPEGALAEDHDLEVDWFFHSPVGGLSDAEVRAQVEALRDQQLPRVNTMGAPFEDRTAENARLRILGPATATCGESGTWQLDVVRGGTTYHATFRYREQHRDGEFGPWHSVHQPTLQLTLGDNLRALHISGQAQDQWEPRAPTTAPNGWQTPHPDNFTTEAERRIPVTCP